VSDVWLASLLLWVGAWVVGRRVRDARGRFRRMMRGDEEGEMRPEALNPFIGYDRLRILMVRILS
jgi:hypothetical protein